MRTCDPTRSSLRVYEPLSAFSDGRAGTGLNTGRTAHRAAAGGALDAEQAGALARLIATRRSRPAAESGHAYFRWPTASLHLPLADPAAVLARAGPAALHLPSPAWPPRFAAGRPTTRCCTSRWQCHSSSLRVFHPVVHLAVPPGWFLAVRPRGSAWLSSAGRTRPMPGASHRGGPPLTLIYAHRHVARPAGGIALRPELPPAHQRRRLNSPPARRGRGRHARVRGPPAMTRARCSPR